MPACISNDIGSLVDVLQYRVKKQANQIAYRFLPIGEDQAIELSYSQLDQQARGIASELLKHCNPGDRALMVYPSGLNFISAFLGCLYAGVVAVPAYPPRKNQKLDRLHSMARDCDAQLLLTATQTSGGVARAYKATPFLAKYR